MAIRMNLTITQTAAEDIQLRRNDLAQQMGGKITAFDLAADVTIADALSRFAKKASLEMQSVATKAGMKQSRPDLEFGLNGSERHPVEFWAQRIFS